MATKTKQSAAKTPVSQGAEAQAQAQTAHSLGDASIVYATAAELGKTFGRSAIREASDLQTFAYSFKHAGCESSFEAYQAFANDFKAAAKDAGWQAPQDLWERTCATARGLNLIGDKPKATTAAATVKAEQRTKAAEVLKGKTAVELKAEAEALAKAGNLVEAGKVARQAEIKVKEAQREAVKAARESCKPMIDSVREAIDAMLKANDVTGLGYLSKVARMLAAGQHVQVGKAIKPLKVNV
jgi:hypothetical protein